MSLLSPFRRTRAPKHLAAPAASPQDTRPGSAGEHLIQDRDDTRDRAERFYRTQFATALTPRMIEFISRMELAFIATSDSRGECDSSMRAGAPGFIRVLGTSTLAYPEYRGNGVLASLGNIAENPHIGIFLVDFTRDLIGLHVNGEARILTRQEMQLLDPGVPDETSPGRRAEHWVAVRVEEAYVHCSKHIPKLVPGPRVRHWGTDNPRHKGGDFFGVSGT